MENGTHLKWPEETPRHPSGIVQMSSRCFSLELPVALLRLRTETVCATKARPTFLRFGRFWLEIRKSTSRALCIYLHTRQYVDPADDPRRSQAPYKTRPCMYNIIISITQKKIAAS